ncbi:MAG: histidine kinase [Rhodospirillales bacterium]|nr:MAG: histidine kinase [Rhodospirillales bacterium]
MTEDHKHTADPVSSGKTAAASRPFRIAHAAADDWAHAAQACADQLGPLEGECNLGFLYASDQFAGDLAKIVNYLKQHTGLTTWIGTVGTGISAGDCEYTDRTALAVMAASFADGSFRVFPAISRDPTQLSAANRAWITSVSPGFGIVHGDPGNPETPRLVSELARHTAGFLVGGLTSSRGACHQLAGRVTGGGVSGVLFAPSVAVQTGLSQGCTPVGPSHLISDCVENVLIGLDGRRALDVFKEDVGELLARDLSRVAGYIHAALPLPGCDTGDYMVRNLMAIDPVHGWLAIGERVAPGDRVVFVRRDPLAARDDLRAMLGNLRGRLGESSRGGIYFSCVARGANMFGAPGVELAILREVLGDLPVIGVSCAGEISNGRLYGYTGVLAVFG